MFNGFSSLLLVFPHPSFSCCHEGNWGCRRGRSGSKMRMILPDVVVWYQDLLGWQVHNCWLITRHFGGFSAAPIAQASHFSKWRRNVRPLSRGWHGVCWNMQHTDNFSIENTFALPLNSSPSLTEPGGGCWAQAGGIGNSVSWPVLPRWSKRRAFLVPVEWFCLVKPQQLRDYNKWPLTSCYKSIWTSWPGGGLV